MYVVGLGSNLGSRQATIDAALAWLDAREDCSVVSRSPSYETEPLGPPQPRYLNAAARVHSVLQPEPMLAVLLEIEAALGRVRRERWGARVIDLDLLWAPLPYRSAQLTLPHEGLRDRIFALAPLLDVAPELDVAYGERLRALLAAEPGGAASLRKAARVTAAITRDAQDRACVEIEAQGPAPEAAAAVITALGGLLAAPCVTLQAHPLRAEPAMPGDARALLEKVVEHARAGLRFQHASVDDACATARVLGAPGAANALQLLDLTSEPARVAMRVRMPGA